jgi:hypothetical protein
MSFCLLLVTAGLAQATPPHRGTLTRAGDGWLELVASPGRVALYPLNAKLAPAMPDGAQALLVAGPDEIPLTRAGDHWEIDRPAPSSVLVAVVRKRSGSAAARFDVIRGGSTMYHDHRPFHGGQVGMAGERHLELALSRGRSGAELQLYLTDAYRQPISLTGIGGTITVRQGGHATSLALVDGGDCLIAKVPPPHETLDVHVALRYPTAPQDVEMDFLVAPGQAEAQSGRPVLIHVTSGGFSPNRIEAHAGEALTLRFLRTTDQTCATSVRFPAEGIDRALPLDRPVEVALVPTRGEVDFACGTGMFKGSVVAR